MGFSLSSLNPFSSSGSALGGLVGGMGGGLAGIMGGSAAGSAMGMGNGSGSGGVDWQGLIGSQSDMAKANNTTNRNNISALQTRLNGMTAPATVAPAQLSLGNQFDVAREAQSESNAQNTGTANDALARKFAAMGGGPSGAEVKAQTNLSTQEAAQNDQAMAKINEGEAQAKTEIQNQQAQMNQQAQEFNTQMGQTYQQFGFSANSQIAQLDSMANQQQEDSATTAFNENLQQYQAQHSGGLLGAGGFLGTGIGA